MHVKDNLKDIIKTSSCFMSSRIGTCEVLKIVDKKNFESSSINTRRRFTCVLFCFHCCSREVKMKNSFLSNDSIIFQLYSLSMVISDTLYIAYFAEMRFSREMDRDCCWDTRGRHGRRGSRFLARKQESHRGLVSRVRGTEITRCSLSILDSFVGELAA